MALDGITLRAVAAELHAALQGGRIDKALQPERDEIHLVIRNKGENHRLLLSSSAAHARVHLTQAAKPNPLKAPMFCMFLRKWLQGGMVLGVEQVRMERVLEIRILTEDDMGSPTQLTLVCEMMGRHSNIILLNAQGQIMDSIKHVPEEKSRVREVLPGLAYSFPPSQGKRNPLGMDLQAFESLMADCQDDITKHVSAALEGCSPMTARALLCGAFEDPGIPGTRLSPAERTLAAKTLFAHYRAVQENRFQAVLVYEPGASQPRDVLALDDPLYPPSWRQPRESINAALDEFYILRSQAEHLKQRTGNTERILKTALERCQRKLEKQQETLFSAEKADQYQLWGELLTASLFKLKRGMESITLENYYDPDNGTVAIPLDPRKAPADNAQALYKKYRKAKTALDLVQRQMNENLAEIDYLETQLLNLSQCVNLMDIEEIQGELAREGYIKQAKTAGKAQAAPNRPYHFRAGGHDIFVGRNNKQNEDLTLHFARGNDLWLHTQGIPGSHVVIQAKDGLVSPQAIEQGALLAAYYSQARASSHVPVDYTLRRNIKKPSGAKPGYVTYSTHQTAVVTPSEESIRQLERAD